MASPKLSSPMISRLSTRLYELDLSGCLFLNKYCRQRAVNQFFSGVSRLGDGVFWYSIGAVLPLLYGLEGLFVTLEFTVLGLLCLVIYKSMKRNFYRARPFVSSNRVIKGCAPLDVCSFPSGHTMHACAFTFIILWHFPIFAAVLIPFALLVAASRMVLGLHYPSDVLIGATLGLSIAAAGCMGFDQLAHLGWWL